MLEFFHGVISLYIRQTQRYASVCVVMQTLKLNKVTLWVWRQISQTTNQVYMFPLGTYTTVFQAEVFAICACVKTLLMESEASMPSALTVRRRWWRCNLQPCCWDNESTDRIVYVQQWIPSHSDVRGNETADQFAKQAVSQDFVGPEPVLGRPTTKILSACRLWTNAQQCKLWQTTSGCQQAQMFLHGPDKKTFPLCSW